ncbi:predicted protein [Histoplasma mississippiense (nom. inval.)]|uniref:predicted protein n=1 Tax=Ajellomyces capsulatus (strain NAm1 / WU24) TaxID=2059318 RepID=UPI000157BC7B|nr:predicted protein [Histoplasma mississippiense (nom. inval.)]EDN06094.1 predicted protein [Histoplasma mississippiense (nom. inval.)]
MSEPAVFIVDLKSMKNDMLSAIESIGLDCLKRLQNLSQCIAVIVFNILQHLLIIILKI